MKGFTSPVTAEPLTDGFSLPPAGGLYPLHCRNGRLILDWEQGFVSGLLLLLASRGVVPESVNAERLCREIRRKAGGDPFNLDRDGIVRSLITGAFRVTDIKKLPEEELSFTPGSGIWFTESPFSPLFETGPDDLLSLELTHGFHHLVNLNASEHYDIFVDEREQTLLKLP
jgi:hypothetical protein